MFSLYKREKAPGLGMDMRKTEKRSWLLAGLWFGSIALLGLLKRSLEKQQKK